MKTSASQSPVVRFGVFELDLRSEELRKQGMKIRLQGKPVEILTVLLERPGEVVTREDLQKKLWPADTFVDFEQGLNNAMKRLRAALDDAAESPHFIETVPRRGYRFIGALNGAGQTETAEVVVGRKTSEPSLAAPFLTKSWRTGSVLLAAALVVVLIFIFRPPQSPRILRYTQLTNDGLQKGRLATDGSRIYFDEQSPHEFIAEVSTKGGAVTRLVSLPMESGPHPDFSPVLDYSPLRSELLIRIGISLSPLSAVSVPGSTSPRRLGDIVAEDAAWSPDGQSIAFSRANEIDMAQADGSQPRKLVTLQGDAIYLRWSPDGKALRFTFCPSLQPGGSSSIWEIARDGSNLHPVFPDWRVRSDVGGAWTADGKYFVFRSIRNGRGSIFVIREKKDLLARTIAQPVELTSGPMSFTAPVPSPDGKQIFTEGFLDRGELVRYDGERRTWEHYLSGISATNLDFSRDGEWVTYVLVPDGTLWRSRVDGSQRLQLSIPPLRALLPRWSPDGRDIAFMGMKPGGTWTIYRVPADGGETEQLLSEKEYFADPNWSPDGSQLVFGESKWSPKAIHILDLKSRRVSDLPGSAGLFSPRWSPDGRSIIALTANMVPSPPPAKIMVFDLSGRAWQEWCEAPYISYPEFSRNSNYVYFSDSTTGFFRVRRGSNKIERVATLDSPGAIKMDPFWYWTGLTPDDSPIFLHDTSTREIYALDVDFP